VWPRTRENLGDNKPTTEKKRTFEVADPRGESSKCPVCDSRSGDIKNRVGSEKTDRVCMVTPKNLSTRHSRARLATVDTVGFAMGAPKTKVR
jgi:hypothetical protein